MCAIVCMYSIEVHSEHLCIQIHYNSHVCLAVVRAGRQLISHLSFPAASPKGRAKKATAESERQYLDYIFHQNNRLSPSLANGSSPTI